MLDKLKRLLNVKGWLEGIVVQKVVMKGAKAAVAAVIGLLGTAVFATKVKPVLDSLGIQIDQHQLEATLMVTLTGVAGALMNWFKYKVLKEPVVAQ